MLPSVKDFSILLQKFWSNEKEKPSIHPFIHLPLSLAYQARKLYSYVPNRCCNYQFVFSFLVFLELYLPYNKNNSLEENLIQMHTVVSGETSITDCTSGWTGIPLNSPFDMKRASNTKQAIQFCTW